MSKERRVVDSVAILCGRSPLSEENYPNRNPAWKQALLIADFQGDTRKGSSTSLSGTSLQAQTGVPRSEED